ncbi:MAG: winged helix-turn-helix domain-containing protein [Candidatus Hodarchaeaceae archaeon]|nr:winged helix-turn-helix domain-containing protein [Candidatus Hodarchaeaceae archaeon]
MLIDEKRIKALAELTGGMGQTIIQSLKKEKSVRGLARELKLAPSTICYHLKRLEGLGLVDEVKQKYGDKRMRLYKATGGSTAYLILLNLPEEEKRALKREFAGVPSRKGYIIKDIFSLLLTAGAGFKVWTLLRELYPPSVSDAAVRPSPNMADILLLLVLFATLIYLQRSRLISVLGRSTAN